MNTENTQESFFDRFPDFETKARLTECISLLTGINKRTLWIYFSKYNLNHLMNNPYSISASSEQHDKIVNLRNIKHNYNLLKMSVNNEFILKDIDQLAKFAYNYTGKFGITEKEVFLCMYFDHNDKLLDCMQMLGTIDEAPVYAREIIKQCMNAEVSHVVFAHNHPGKTLVFSGSDSMLTNRLKDIFTLLGIKVRDHLLIVTDDLNEYNYICMNKSSSRTNYKTHPNDKLFHINKASSSYYMKLADDLAYQLSKHFVSSKSRSDIYKNIKRKNLEEIFTSGSYGKTDKRICDAIYDVINMDNKKCCVPEYYKYTQEPIGTSKIAEQVAAQLLKDKKECICFVYVNSQNKIVDITDYAFKNNDYNFYENTKKDIIKELVSSGASGVFCMISVDENTFKDGISKTVKQLVNSYVMTNDALTLIRGRAPDTIIKFNEHTYSLVNSAVNKEDFKRFIMSQLLNNYKNLKAESIQLLKNVFKEYDRYLSPLELKEEYLKMAKRDPDDRCHVFSDLKKVAEDIKQNGYDELYKEDTDSIESILSFEVER